MSAAAKQIFSVANSSQLHARSCRALALGVSSGLRRHIAPAPLFFERGEGPYLFDVDGHKLLDYTLGWGPLILGNNHPAINAAVTAQLSRGYTFGAQHRGEYELAELLIDVLPGVERVIFSNTGTEAVQAALRLARAYTGRTKVVKFEGHYHGWLNNILVSYRLKPADPCQPMPACGGQPEAEYAETLVLPWNDLAAVENAFRQFQGQIACIITEPILANGGCCLPEPGYLQGLVELCRQHGAVSIFDEVITGFRIALGGVRECEGVRPDLSVYAKALAGGLALSAVAGRAEAFQALEDGRTIHAGTYNGNPISLAAARATIETLRAPGVFDGMHAHGQAIRDIIHCHSAARGVKLITVGLGTVFSIHFGIDQAPRTYRDTLAADDSQYRRFRLAMLRGGVHLLPDGRWYVGATHGDQELAIVDAAVEQAFQESAG
ncbi:MAG: aspartate aminotransferase family protein [Pirellulales bacterium]|nr:aspartate aminotransferase family protein [Pirellulales bacterium]